MALLAHDASMDAGKGGAGLFRIWAAGWAWTGCARWARSCRRPIIGTGWRCAGCWTICPPPSATSPGSCWRNGGVDRWAAKPCRRAGPHADAFLDTLEASGELSVAKLMLASSQIQNLA